MVHSTAGVPGSPWPTATRALRRMRKETLKKNSTIKHTLQRQIRGDFVEHDVHFPVSAYACTVQIEHANAIMPAGKSTVPETCQVVWAPWTSHRVAPIIPSTERYNNLNSTRERCCNVMKKVHPQLCNHLEASSVRPLQCSYTQLSRS